MVRPLPLDVLNLHIDLEPLLRRSGYWSSDRNSREDLMDFKKLADKAKKTLDDRGGMESLKADA